MNLNIGADRSTLISDARQEWVQRQQNKTSTAGATGQSYAPPPDVDLIAEDPQLAAELAKIEAASEQTIEVAAAGQTSYSRAGTATSSSTSAGRVNVFA